MIRLHVPGLYPGILSSGDTRAGDGWILDDGKRFMVVDGYCGKAADHFIEVLKERKIKTPYLFISHPHWDHYDGIRKIIRNSYFKPRKLFVPDPSSYEDVSNEVKGNKQALRDIIAEAKAKGIPVSYLRNEQNVTLGEIKFTVYQDTKCKYDGNSEGYVNDRSLAFWFPEQSYLSTGDAGMWCVDQYGLKPKWIKCGHHGNNIGTNDIKPSVMAPRLKRRGCIFYWDNDYSTKLTDFLMTGREDAINAKMTILDIHGDINAIWFSKRCVIYKHGKIYRYSCSFVGKSTLVKPTLEDVKAVLKGIAGDDDARVTYLLNRGQNPGLVQKEVNELYKLIKG